MTDGEESIGCSHAESNGHPYGPGRDMVDEARAVTILKYTLPLIWLHVLLIFLGFLH